MNAVLSFKLFELFDESNIYHYGLLSSDTDVDNNNHEHIKYIYTFIDKTNTKYFVRILYYDHYDESMDEGYKNFMTVDFVDEDDFLKNQKPAFGLKYKRTNKFDAVKILNTVFKIVSDIANKLDVWSIPISCTPDRFNAYMFGINKYLPNYINVNEYDKNKHRIYLFNKKYYHFDKNGDVIRTDNDIIVHEADDIINNDNYKSYKQFETNSKTEQIVSLLNAIDENDIQKVKNIIDMKYNILNSQENVSNDDTILTYTVRKFIPNIEILELLIANGADVNIATKDYYTTPLLVAAVNNKNTDAIKILLASGADINTVDKYGSTALMNAAYNGNVITADYLIDNGADPTIKDYDSAHTMIEEGLEGHNDNMRSWLKSYNTQKKILIKYPELYKNFKENDILSPQTIKEFSFLESGLDLNLI